MALGMKVIRTDEWVTGIAQGLNPVKVRVMHVAVERVVKLGNYTKWLDRDGGSPREMTERNVKDSSIYQRHQLTYRAS
jgi:hypothetical protein